MTSPERKALEAKFAIGLESAAALAAKGKSVCCVVSEDRSDGTVIVRMHPEFRGRLPWGTELYVRAAPQPAQQAVDAPYDHGPQAETVDEALRDVSKWLNEHPNRPLDLRHVAMLCHALSAPKPEQQAVGYWRLISESESGVIRSLIEVARITYQVLDDSEEITGHSGQYISVSKGDRNAIVSALDALDDLPDDRPGYTLGPAGKAEWALRMLLEQNSTAATAAQQVGSPT